MCLRLFIFIIVVLQSLLLAAEGDLDSSFGTNGIVITHADSSWDDALSIAIQSDGKIVAAGYSSIGGTDDFALARYNTDGTLDSSFGTNGVVVTIVGGSNDRAKSVVIQSDGKIVIAGYSNFGGTDDFVLARYLGTPPTLAPIYYLLQ